MSAAPLSSWHAQRSAGPGGTRVFNREWRAHGEAVKSAADYAVTIPAEPRPSKAVTADQVAEIRHSHASNVALSRQLGLDPRVVSGIRKGEITSPAAPFIPLCMDPDELADWNNHNRTAAFAAHGKARTACEDCLWAFALEMRAIDKCNGTPGAAADVEDDEPDEPAERRRTMASVKATVTAPCASCAHQPVCDRLGSLERLAGQINVESTPLHAGLTVAISASIDCDAYLKVRKSPAASPAGVDGINPLTGRKPQSLEQRQASSERMTAIRARQRAEREAQTAEAVE